MPDPHNEDAIRLRSYGRILVRKREVSINVFCDMNGKFYTDHPLLRGPFLTLRYLRVATCGVLQFRRKQLILTQYGHGWRARRASSPMVIEGQQPPPPPSEKPVDDAATFASALFLQEEDLSSLEELLEDRPLEEPITTSSLGTVPHNIIDSSWSSSPFNMEKLAACAAESSSSQTPKQQDDSSSEELLEPKPLEEPIIATPGTVPHNTIDGSSSSFPFSCEKLVQRSDVSSLDTFLNSTSSEESITANLIAVSHKTMDCSSKNFPFLSEKLVAGAVESASSHTLKDTDLSSLDLDEFLDSTSEESMTDSLRTVTPNTTDGSPTSVPSLGSKILIRSPPNWYEVFYIRMDRSGSFYMYPNLGGPFLCIDEVEIAINRYLDGLRRRARCKEPSNIVDRLVHNCKYYLDGTPKRGLGAPSRDTHDEKRHLVQALLDQYSEEHNLLGNLELEDILMRQWIYEDERCFYHLNFTAKKKEADDNPSAGKIFFAELSRMQGEDALEVNCCCMIEDDEDNGWCYGCINNGSPGMKHPKSTDAYAGGHLDEYLPFDCDYSSEDEQDEETRLRHMFEGLDDPHVWETLFPSDARSVEVDGI